MPASLNDVRSISASADGSVWAVGNTQQVYKYDPDSDRWQPMPGSLIDIAVGDESNVWGVSADGKVWRWAETTKSWNGVSAPQPGGLVQISASGDGQAWGVSADGKVWRDEHGSGNWEHIPASRGKYVSAGSAKNVFLVDVELLVWRYLPGGPLPWAPASNSPRVLDLVQVSTQGPITPGGSFDAPAYGISPGGDLLKFSGPLTWSAVGSGFKQIAFGGDFNTWTINSDGVAAYRALPNGDAVTAEDWIGSPQKRWDSKDKYDENKSTHLWIVTRAAEVAHGDRGFGKQLFDLFQPGAKQGQSAFHDAVAEGLWDADCVDPYRNSSTGLQVTSTYTSHFYDPATGLNWKGGSTPTAFTEASKFFAEAVSHYKNGDIRAAGYSLGLSLHYLTDVTQPMHAANYTYLSSAPFGYHTDFESYVIVAMRDVRITQPYEPSPLGDDPGAYVKAIATKSKPRSERITSSENTGWWKTRRFSPWKAALKPEIEGALADGVAITAQYLIAWMRVAGPAIPVSDPRLFVEVHPGAGQTYWALDSDRHLFRRVGWSSGWRLLELPGGARAVSLWPDSVGGVFAVTGDGVQHFTAEEEWERVYPPPLVDDELYPPIWELIVNDRTLWARDHDGAAYTGDGSLSRATWIDTKSPKFTSLGASSNSAWGADERTHEVWEYRGGTWVSRGSGVDQISVDPGGKPWGISPEGDLVTYDGRSWYTPSDLSNATETPGWGALAWVDAHGETFVVVDREGVAWAPSELTVEGGSRWVPLG